MSTTTFEAGQIPPSDPPRPLDPPAQDTGAGATVSATATSSAPAEKPPSGQAPEPPSAPAPDRAASTQTGSPAEQLILERDLNEALLLMDFISGRPDVHISDIGDIKYPARTDTTARVDNADRAGNETPTLSPIAVIRRICALRYPPEANLSIAERADNSALLLCVKDKLNSVAHPANGLTIAYTYMFLEETAQAARDEANLRLRAGIGGKATRASIAKVAYPGLIPSAKRFRCFHKSVARVGAAITVCSALLLWLVVYGVQLTSRFEQDQKSATDLSTQIYALADKENAGVTADRQSHDSVPKRCNGKIDEQSNQMRLLCNQWSYLQKRYEKAINDVGSFANTWPSAWLMIPFPTAPTLQNKADGAKGTQEDVQSITLVLSAYASYVLPVLFGLVGTIASFLRDISNRITANILSPRDETLAIIRIILGAIAGLAVGLFFTPNSLAAQISSGAGVLTLSASGIAFLAGYGADGFFRMIDGMITRVFSLDQNQKPVHTK
ncbi:hypothetical protein P3T43_000682 [Paraburkholderia sp. GAS41]|jgi:hypothetical protein|uniref:hypothetical protein n=1 Tax=Paraburkholderia sp. GAS41 TaxID=3035134 RepID=UPI003D24F22A